MLESRDGCAGNHYINLPSQSKSILITILVQFSWSVMSDSKTPWSAAHQASLSTNNSWSLLKVMSIESGMPSNHPILCCPLFLLLPIFPSIRVFFSNSVFTSGGQSIGTSASVSVFPMNIQAGFPLELIGLISLQYKGLSRVFHNTVGNHQFFSSQLSL